MVGTKSMSVVAQAVWDIWKLEINHLEQRSTKQQSWRGLETPLKLFSCWLYTKDKWSDPVHLLSLFSGSHQSLICYLFAPSFVKTWETENYRSMIDFIDQFNATTAFINSTVNGDEGWTINRIFTIITICVWWRHRKDDLQCTLLLMPLQLAP